MKAMIQIDYIIQSLKTILGISEVTGRPISYYSKAEERILASCFNSVHIQSARADVSKISRRSFS